MSARRVLVCVSLILLIASSASAARYQRTKDGKTLVWNNLRGVAQEVTWSGLRDLNGYATGEGTLTWYRLGGFVNSYTGKMVHGKFEGPVIRLQGNTKVQANFEKGERVSNWVEPGGVAASATSSPSIAPLPLATTPTPATPEQTETPSIEPKPIASPVATATTTPRLIVFPSPTPIPTLMPHPSPFPTSTATAIATPRTSPSPTSTATATVRPSPTPTPTPTPRPSPSPTATSTPQIAPSEAPLPFSTQTPSGLQLASPASPTPLSREQSPQPSPKITASAGATGRRQIDPALKRQMIGDFKKQIDSVLSEVRDVTQNFREVDRLDQVRPLPSSVSGEVTVLANYARQFQAKLGYDVTYYECLSEIETVDALGLVDEVTRDLGAKDAPSARNKLSTFRKRYSEPTVESRKALWRYLVSIFSLCDRLKTEAQGHLERAHSLESAGQLNEALREYREIYRIYPNPITAEKIRQLESRPRQ